MGRTLYGETHICPKCGREVREGHLHPGAKIKVSCKEGDDGKLSDVDGNSIQSSNRNMPD